MGRFVDYPTMTAPADADTLLVIDASATRDKTQQLPLSTLKTYLGSSGSYGGGETPTGGTSLPVTVDATSSIVLTAAGATIVCTYDSGTITLTLPAASSCTNGDLLVIKSATAQDMTIQCAGSDSIDMVGLPSDTLTAWQFVQFVCDGSGLWYRIAKGGLV